MICHKWPFRWDKEARLVWDEAPATGPAPVEASPQPTPEEPKTREGRMEAAIVANEAAVDAAVTKVEGLDSGAATTFVQEAATRIDTEHDARLAAITGETAEAAGQRNDIAARTARDVQQIADLGEEIAGSSQTLDTTTIEALSQHTANVQIINAQDIAAAQQEIRTRLGDKDRKTERANEKDPDGLLSEEILKNVLQNVITDPQVFSLIMSNDAYREEFFADVSRKETLHNGSTVNVADVKILKDNLQVQAKLIDRIIADHFKDVVLHEGDMIVCEKTNDGFGFTIQKAQEVRQEAERQMAVTAQFDGPGEKLRTQYAVGLTKTPKGQSLTLPTGSNPAAYDIPNYATDVQITGDEEKKTLTIAVTASNSKVETTVIQLPDKPPTLDYGTFGEKNPVKGILFEGDYAKAIDAMKKNEIIFSPEGKAGKISIDGKTWSLEGNEQQISLRADETTTILTIRDTNGVQTLTINNESHKVESNVTVLNDGTVVSKKPGTDPALRKTGSRMGTDGRTLETRQGHMDITRGGTLTNTEVSTEGDGNVIVVRGINTKGEITQYTIDPKTEPQNETVEELPHPDVKYEKGAGKLLEAQGFAGGEIHFETKKLADRTILAVKTDEIPNGTTFTPENGRPEDAKAALAQDDVSRFTEIKIDKKDDKTLEVTATTKDGETKKSTIVFAQTKHERKKDERAERKDIKDGGKKETVPAEKTVTEVKSDTQPRIPMDSGEIQVEGGDRDRATFAAKKDLALKACEAVFGTPEKAFDFNTYTIEEQEKILAATMPYMKMTFLTTETGTTAQASFPNIATKLACFDALNDIKNGTAADTENQLGFEIKEDKKITIANITFSPIEGGPEQDNYLYYNATLTNGQNLSLLIADTKMQRERNMDKPIELQIPIPLKEGETVGKTITETFANKTELEARIDELNKMDSTAITAEMERLAPPLSQAEVPIEPQNPTDDDADGTVAEKEPLSEAEAIQKFEEMTKHYKEIDIESEEQITALLSSFEELESSLENLPTAKKAEYFRERGFLKLQSAGLKFDLSTQYGTLTSDSEETVGNLSPEEQSDLKARLSSAKKDYERAIDLFNSAEKLSKEESEQKEKAGRTQITELINSVEGAIVQYSEEANETVEEAKRELVAYLQKWYPLAEIRVEWDGRYGTMTLKQGETYSYSYQLRYNEADKGIKVWSNIILVDESSPLHPQNIQAELNREPSESEVPLEADFPVSATPEAVAKMKTLGLSIEQGILLSKTEGVVAAFNQKQDEIDRDLLRANLTPGMLTPTASVNLSVQGNDLVISGKDEDESTWEYRGTDLTALKQDVQIKYEAKMKELAEKPKVELIMDAGANEALTRNGWNIDMNTLVLNKGDIKIDLNGTTIKNKQVEIITLPDNKLKLTSLDVNNLTETYILDLTKSDITEMLTKLPA